MAEQAHPGLAIRSAGIAATATALVAIVAMSAAASASPAPAAAGIEGRLDSRVVRLVAAVVAAAARDSADRVTPAALRLDAPAAVPGATSAPGPAPAGQGSPPRPALLGERLLDLPPPAR
jgi:hypothetical protein